MALKVPPFVAPSPQLVAETLVGKFGLLMENLLPTAIEAICGFLLGNLAAWTFSRDGADGAAFIGFLATRMGGE